MASHADTDVVVKFNRLPEASRRIDDAAKEILREGANDVKVRADGRKPDKVPSRVKSDKDGYLVEFGSSKIFWGHFYEFGTILISAKPFATPAAESAFPAIKLKLSRLEKFLW